jgi:hypothetical protein
VENTFLGRGYQIKTKRPIIQEYSYWDIIRGLTYYQWSFCQWNTSDVERDYSPDAPMFHPYCWNDTKTFDHHLYQTAVDICSSTDCISKYRLKDGSRDCVRSVDENNHVSSSCQSITSYRFHCLEEDTCLLVDNINTYEAPANCTNNYYHGLAFRSVHCRERHDSNCQILKDFVARSSVLPNITRNNLMTNDQSKLLFHQCCDTFFNHPSRLDEYPPFCQHWICPKNQYQCSSGQCIPPEWICDGKRKINQQ